MCKCTEAWNCTLGFEEHKLLRAGHEHSESYGQIEGLVYLSMETEPDLEARTFNGF